MEDIAPEDIERFHEVVLETLTHPGLLAEFDRLKGTNLRLLGSPINIHVDIGSGRLANDVQKFVIFVHQCVWSRLKDGAGK